MRSGSSFASQTTVKSLPRDSSNDVPSAFGGNPLMPGQVNDDGLSAAADDLFEQELVSPGGSARRRPQWRQLYAAHAANRAAQHDFGFAHRDYGGKGNRMVSLLPPQLQDWYELMPPPRIDCDDYDEDGGGGAVHPRGGAEAAEAAAEHEAAAADEHPLLEQLFERHHALLLRLAAFVRAEAAERGRPFVLRSRCHRRRCCSQQQQQQQQRPLFSSVGGGTGAGALRRNSMLPPLPHGAGAALPQTSTRGRRRRRRARGDGGGAGGGGGGSGGGRQRAALFDCTSKAALQQATSTESAAVVLRALVRLAEAAGVGHDGLWGAGQGVPAVQRVGGGWAFTFADRQRIRAAQKAAKAAALAHKDEIAAARCAAAAALLQRHWRGRSGRWAASARAAAARRTGVEALGQAAGAAEAAAPTPLAAAHRECAADKAALAAAAAGAAARIGQVRVLGAAADVPVVPAVTSCFGGSARATAAVVGAACGYAGLASLSLRGCARLSAADVAAIGCTLAGLTTLDLSGAAACGDAELAALAALPALRTLELCAWGGLTAQGLEAWASALPRTASLPGRWLLPSGPEPLVTAGDGGGGSAAGARSARRRGSRRRQQQPLDAPHLTALNLSDCKQLGDAAAAAIGRHLHGVVDLCLFGLLQLTDVGACAAMEPQSRLARLCHTGAYKCGDVLHAHCWSINPALQLYSTPGEFGHSSAEGERGRGGGKERALLAPPCLGKITQQSN